MQQRLLQRLQRGVLPLVEAGEALGFFVVFMGQALWAAYGVVLASGKYTDRRRSHTRLRLHVLIENEWCAGFFPRFDMCK